jgi:L-arabinose transport system substrate-binding protein
VALARAAHIPIMASDNGFAGPHGKAVPFVGIDATAFGESTGRGLVEWYKKLGWTPANTYELLYVVPSLPTCNLRTNAEKSVLESAGFPSSHIIDVPYDGTETKGFDNTGPVVTAHPGVVHWMLSGCNTDGPAGGAKYLTSHGVSPNNIIVSGLGGDLVCQLWAPGAPNLGIRTTNFISGYDIGADAVRDMYDYVVKHQPFPADTYVKPVRLTPKNYLKIDTACKAS